MAEVKDFEVVVVTRGNIKMVSEKTGRTEEALLRALKLAEAHNEIMHIALWKPWWRK